jgi:hypothetical protein
MVSGRLVLAALCAATTGLFAQPSRPLPDQERFFAETRKHLASNDLIQSRYSFRERSTELRLNPFGRTVGTGPVNTYEVYPHPEEELTYRRLIERDGKPLDASEIADQDQDYRERLADWLREHSRENASERELRQRKAAEARQKDAALAREALDLFDFQITGRDTWDGQPAIIVSFSPRPGGSPRSREGRVAYAFAGRAWVHEHEHQVMNVEAQAIADVSFGWGMIAKLHRGSKARFTRRRIDGHWLPVETRFEGTGRALMVRRVVIKFSRDYFDYKPFDFSELPARLGWAP